MDSDINLTFTGLATLISCSGSIETILSRVEDASRNVPEIKGAVPLPIHYQYELDLLVHCFRGIYPLCYFKIDWVGEGRGVYGYNIYRLCEVHLIEVP